MLSVHVAVTDDEEGKKKKKHSGRKACDIGTSFLLLELLLTPCYPAARP